MRNVAFTIVQNDMVILELWLKYYSKWFDDLYVIGNGTKAVYGDLEPLREKYNFTFERIGYQPTSSHTIVVVTDTQHKLVEKYDWVLYSDCDEIITPNLELYKDFHAFFKAYPGNKVICEGFNILHDDGEPPIDYAKPYMKQRKYWYKNMSYNKPLLSKISLNWAEGCHREVDVHDTIGKAKTCTGLLLIHLKYGDLKPLEPRDFGPTISTFESNVVEQGKVDKVEIPEIYKEII